MNVELAIRNAPVVTPGGTVHGGVAVDEGKIVAIAADDALPEAKVVIDGERKYQIPGLDE